MSTRTLGIIKPDATRRNLMGPMLTRYADEGFTVLGMRMTVLTRAEAEGFYAEHSARPFFGELVDFMTSGPVVLLALKAENAVKKHRELMGATNPENAAEGTLRKTFALSLTENSVHGSDSDTSAERELSYFFRASDLCC